MVEGCRVDGCERAARSGRQNICGTHYFRIYRGSALPLDAPVRVKSPTPGCSIEGCTRPAPSNTLCSMHATRKHRSHPQALDPSPLDTRNGPASYGNVHRRLKTDRGAPGTHHCGCGREALDWAMLHECPHSTTEDGRTHCSEGACYTPMCRRCHMHYDDHPWIKTEPEERPKWWMQADGQSPK